MAAAASHPPRPTTGSRTRPVALLAVAALTLAACGGGADDVGTIRLSHDEPDLAPSADDLGLAGPVTTVDVEFATFDGGVRNLNEYAGQALVVNFFAATCGFCIAEMPEFEAVYQEVKGDVAFLGLALDPVAATLSASSPRRGSATTSAGIRCSMRISSSVASRCRQPSS